MTTDKSNAVIDFIYNHIEEADTQLLINKKEKNGKVNSPTSKNSQFSKTE